jgi:hypothetical protein
MSAVLLMGESQFHTLADDLESFLHVLGWVALRFMRRPDLSSPPFLDPHD